jgi:hypothetical protein
MFRATILSIFRSILLLPFAELSLIADSFGLLNDLLLPFLSILDASCPIFDLHLANVLFDVILFDVILFDVILFDVILFDVILPSVLVSSL